MNKNLLIHVKKLKGRSMNQSKNDAIEIPMAFILEAEIAFRTCKGYLVPIDKAIFENVALSSIKIKDR